MKRKIFTLSVLYYVQGLPYGFQDKFIPTYLRLSGFSHTKLSLMKLLLIPWLCKAMFAPLVDLVWTKQFWLLSSLCGLTVTALLGVLIPPEYFLIVSLWLFTLNLLSAFQDVAVDGLALHMLKSREMGIGNTAQVIGYKLGALSGGGMLFWIHFYYGWPGLCLSFSCLYGVSVIIFMLLYGHCGKKDVEFKEPLEEEPDELLTEVEKEGLRRRRSVRRSISEVKDELVQKVIERTDNFYSAFKTVFNNKGTLSFMFFLLIYKLGEKGASSIFPLFLLDMGTTTKQIGFWNGLVGQFSSLCGSIYGGWMISQNWKIHHLVFWVCLARTVPLFLQWMIINIWPATSSTILHQILFFFGVSSMLSLEFTAGLTTTSVFSLMMTCSLKAPATIQSTHYSVLSSVEVAGKLIFASIAGALIDWLGLSFVYMIFIVLSLVTVLIIPLLD